jgi:hypothetical protein
MLHVELTYVGIVEILPVTVQILFAHLIGVDKMCSRMLNLNIILQMSEKIRIILICVYSYILTSFITFG